MLCYFNHTRRFLYCPSHCTLIKTHLTPRPCFPFQNLISIIRCHFPLSKQILPQNSFRQIIILTYIYCLSFSVVYGKSNNIIIIHINYPNRNKNLIFLLYFHCTNILYLTYLISIYSFSYNIMHSTN